MTDSLNSPELYITREWSWLEFNRRVLQEALDPTNPLLERLKFACIFSSNLDEFFMVRVAGLRSRTAADDSRPDQAGLTPSQQLDGIAQRVHAFVARQYALLREELVPALAEQGLEILQVEQLDASQTAYVDRVYESEIFPVLTPVALDPDRPFPVVANLSVNLAVLLAGEPAGRTLTGRGDTGPEESDVEPAPAPPAEAEDRLALVRVPANLPRLVSLSRKKGTAFVLLEDIIRHRLAGLFRGQAILDVAAFRITRDAELIFDDEGGDTTFLRVVETELRRRRTNQPIRLEVQHDAGDALRERLRELIRVEEQDVYPIDGPLDIRPFMSLTSLPAFASLRNQPRDPLLPSDLQEADSILDAIRRRDILLHHPYDAFDPVARLVGEAADDPDVLALKMTLYRVSGHSPIVRSLIRAAEGGKQVTVLVELMARFDEQANIEWARTLEEAGAQVIYGLAGLKTHSKIALVVRREPDGIRRYVHLGTGNYNDTTARLYTDMALLTCREDLGADATGFFNTITGFSDPPHYRQLAMAPLSLRQRLVALIEREAERAQGGQPSGIMAKVNSLQDPAVIQALYRASQSGVPVRLNVRGICCLRPGVPGVSETIEVCSIVDRYLEHSRICHFVNGGEEEVYLSSADWMTRNLDKRVELMFPVEDKACKRVVLEALHAFFADNTRTRWLQPDGSYVRREPGNDERPLRCQDYLYELTRRRYRRQEASARTQFRPQSGKSAP